MIFTVVTRHFTKKLAQNIFLKNVGDDITQFQAILLTSMKDSSGLYQVYNFCNLKSNKIIFIHRQIKL